MAPTPAGGPILTSGGYGLFLSVLRIAVPAIQDCGLGIRCYVLAVPRLARKAVRGVATGVQRSSASGRAAVVAILLAALSLGGCAARPTGPEDRAIYRETNDPFEPMNRSVFWFNEKLDVVFLRPVAIGYRKALPRGVRAGIGNFLDNLESPVILLNELLQGEWQRAGDTAGRFMANTILGLGGLIDIASDAGVPKHDEDFGQTLAVWGVESGPYLVLPVLGSTNFRDGLGLAADSVADPFGLLAADDMGEEVAIARWSLDTIDWRADNIETIDDLRRSSLDFYAAVRSAYRQQRASAVANGRNGPGGPNGDDLDSLPLVDFDFDDDLSEDSDNGEAGDGSSPNGQ